MNCTELQIQSGNIFGLFRNINGFIYNKLNEPEFVQQTKKTNILGLIETHHTADDIDLIILNLDRMFFNLMEDTYLFFAYCSPANSSYTQRTDNDPFSEIEENISNLGTNAQILLLGDLNARTGEDNSDLFLPDSYNTNIVATYPRGNRDPVKNQYGETLTSLCKSVPPRIYNGRKLGDTVGNFTCHKWNGQSAVDYCLASPGTNI